MTHASTKQYTGFTIVELLIVIVIIAILAAVSVIAYNGIQNRAYDTTLESDLKNIAKRYELLRIDSSNGQYPLPSSLTAASSITPSKNAYKMERNNLYICVNLAGDAFAISAQAKSNTYFVYSSLTGTITNPSSNVTAGSNCTVIDTVYNETQSRSAYNYNTETGTGNWTPWAN